MTEREEYKQYKFKKWEWGGEMQTRRRKGDGQQRHEGRSVTVMPQCSRLHSLALKTFVNSYGHA